jgi:hypothetical protein
MSKQEMTPAEMREAANRLRANAMGADCLWQSAWFLRLAAAEEAQLSALDDYRRAYERAEEAGKDPEKAASAWEGAWQRAVNHRDRIEAENFIP